MKNDYRVIEGVRHKLEIQIGTYTITTQTFFKLFFPIVFTATLILIISSIVSNEKLFTALNIIATGSTYLCFYFSRNS